MHKATRGISAGAWSPSLGPAIGCLCDREIHDVTSLSLSLVSCFLVYIMQGRRRKDMEFLLALLLNIKLC